MKSEKYNSDILDIGLHPVSNRFVEKKDEISPHYKIELGFDKKNSVIKLLRPFPLDEIRPVYDWITCFEPESHLDELIDIILNYKHINKNTNFYGFSFKDDSCLERLKKKGYQNTWRIDPEKDLEITERFSSVETLQIKFTKKNAKKIISKRKPGDVFFVRHVLEHSYDIDEFLTATRVLTQKEGLIVFEIPDCLKSLNSGNCAMIWEEHIYYFTEKTFMNFLSKNGFEVLYFKTWKYEMENSIVAIVRTNTNKQIYNLNNKLNDENLELFRQYKTKILMQKKSIKKKLMDFRKKKGKIAIFGAGHLSVTFISIYELWDVIDFAIDDNPNKVNLFLPSGNIPISSSKILNYENIKLCLLGLNPEHHNKIIKKFKKFTDESLIFSSIFPKTNNYIEDLI